jgi:hypothetical protein
MASTRASTTSWMIRPRHTESMVAATLSAISALLGGRRLPSTSLASYPSGIRSA